MTLEKHKQNHAEGNVEGASEGNVMDNAERAYPCGEAEPTIIVCKHQESCKKNCEC